MSQDTDKNERVRGTHLLETAEGLVRTWGENEKARGTPLMRWQQDGQVKNWKEGDRARGTHELGSAEGEMSQDMKRKQLSKGHSPTGDCRGRESDNWQVRPVRGREPLREGRKKTTKSVAHVLVSNLRKSIHRVFLLAECPSLGLCPLHSQFISVT